MQSIYVTGDIAELLQTYLDREKLSAPDVSRELARFSAGNRMPMIVWWSLLEKIQHIENKPALGLKIGRYIRPQHSGVLGYLIMYCQTLGEALIRFQRYQLLLHNLSKVQFESTPSSLVISWDTQHGQSTQLSDEVVLSGLLTFMREMTGRKDIKPVSVRFNHEVPYETGHYETIMGCPVTFGHKYVAIEMPVTALALPINSRDPIRLLLLEQQAQALTDKENQQDELLETLKQVVVESFSQGAPTLAAVARHMNLSARTLHRRLEMRNSNFKQFLQQTREKLARLYLNDSCLSLSEIAFLLGYSEQSAFNRAFKRWFGTTPKTYRKNTSTPTTLQ